MSIKFLLFKYLLILISIFKYLFFKYANSNKYIQKYIYYYFIKDDNIIFDLLHQKNL
jgi:hypothetical protein